MQQGEERESGEGKKSQRNKDAARPSRRESRKVRRAFTKSYQKYSSLTLLERKTQENAVPNGQRGQAGPGLSQIAEVLTCIFTSFFTKRCYVSLPGLWVMLRKQPQADILSGV